jgi:hypothetical protein
LKNPVFDGLLASKFLIELLNNSFNFAWLRGTSALGGGQGLLGLIWSWMLFVGFKARFCL